MMHLLPRKMSFGYTVVPGDQEADLLEGLCEGFTRCNQIEILTDPDNFPCCLGCGEIRYVEPKNCVVSPSPARVWRSGKTVFVDPFCQHVLGARQLCDKKEGTCIDLACFLCAIYRTKDGDPGARVVIEHQLDSNGDGIPGKYHAMVMKGSGEIVDPTEKAYQENIAVGASACGCGGES